jgi:hypothetical protein
MPVRDQVRPLRLRRVADQIGGSARGYQAMFMPLAALSSPGSEPMDGQPAVYLSLSHKAVSGRSRGCFMQGRHVRLWLLAFFM